MRAFIIITLVLAAFLAGIAADHYRFVHAALALVTSAPRRLAPPYLLPPGPEQSEDRRLRLAYFRAVAGTADVVMLGDSTTEAGEWAELLPGVRVLNRGIRWDTSADLLARLDEVIAHKPKVVFLMIGVNDVRYGLPAEKVLENIRQITKRLGNAHIRTVLQSTLLISPRLNETTNATLLELDRGIQKFAKEAGLLYLDINSLVTKDGALDPSLTLDGLHLSATTYVRWGAVVASALETISKN